MELVGGGGEHAVGAGGYSAGGGDWHDAGYNGFGSLNNLRTNSYGTAGGYYTVGTGYQYVQVYFNQGGMWQGNKNEVSYNGWTTIYSTSNDAYIFYLDYSGSGGEAGEGGVVYYSDLSKIHAYNGDRITNGDYTTKYYEYEADGTLSSTVANLITKLDGTTIIPAKIFAQSGVIRATYSTNQKMTAEECAFWNVTYITSSTDEQTVNVQITEETTTATTSYGQGIGSGAGNLEKSNGTLKPISEYSE